MSNLYNPEKENVIEIDIVVVFTYNTIVVDLDLFVIIYKDKSKKNNPVRETLHNN